MPTDWHLAYGSTDFAFGTIGSKFVFPSDGAPEVGTADITNGDLQRPGGDGNLFGVDTRAGTTVTFNIEVNGQTEAESWTLLQGLASAWRADEISKTPDAVAMLTSHTGRVAFGRPRRFKQDLALTPFGITAVTCDFATADDLWYGPQQQAVVTLVPAPGGGLIAPLAAPLATTESSDRSQTFTVDGLLPVWPVITITGPITNPTVEVVGQFKLGLNVTLASDQRVVIDTRPWARTIMRGNASLAGKLMPNFDRLSDASVPPGRYELALRGTSATGTPSATLTWRNAFPTQ
jgi:hypothetical protein